MSKLEALTYLQTELQRTLQERKKAKYITKEICTAKIRRLRLQIQELMIQIERECKSIWTKEPEEWE